MNYNSIKGKCNCKTQVYVPVRTMTVRSMVELVAWYMHIIMNTKMVGYNIIWWCLNYQLKCN